MCSADIRDEREGASRQFFNDWAPGYESRRISPWFRYTQELTISNMALPPHPRVLDIGCGTGYAVRTLAERLPSAAAHGLDVSEVMILEARRRVPARLAGRVHFMHGRSGELPYSDASFTNIICTNSFHHYPEPLRALAEMKRVLVPGGQLLIFENAPDLSLYTWAWDRLLRVIEKGHVCYYATRRLGELIEGAGFDRLELRVHRSEFRSHGKLYASIQLWSAHRPESQLMEQSMREMSHDTAAREIAT